VNIVTHSYIIFHLRNRCKQKTDFGKLYQDLSIIVMEADRLDKQLSTKNKERNLFLFWATDIVLRLVIKHISLFFELRLLSMAEYAWVFYQLDLWCKVSLKYFEIFMDKLNEKIKTTWNSNDKSLFMKQFRKFNH